MHEREILAGKAQPVGLLMWDDNINKFVPAKLSKVGGSGYFVPTISVAHHEQHEGETFFVSFHNIALADDGTIEFVFTVDNTMGHLIFSGACGGNATLEFFEGPTSIVAGTPLTEFNKRRASGDAENTIDVIRDPTSIGADGTLLQQCIIPGGTGGNSAGGSSGQRDEWILAHQAGYLLRLTNIAGNTQPASLCAEWYEDDV